MWSRTDRWPIPWLTSTSESIVLKALRRGDATPGTPEDAERLRDALVLALERHAQLRRGASVKQLRSLSKRLGRFPTPTGLERALERALAGPVATRALVAPRRSASPRREPEAVGSAAAQAASALLALAACVALPEPELEDGIASIRRLVPERLGVTGAARLAREAEVLLSAAGPIRRRYMDCRGACLELVETLAQQIELGSDANARVSERAGALVDALGRADDAGTVRALQSELVSGLSAIRADADQIRSALSVCEDRVSELESQLDDRNEALAEARHEATHDPLTGALNRRGYKPLLDQAVTAAHRSGRPLCLLMLDLDHFKNLNDTYGHPAGDMVLQVVARTLQESVRDRDAVARIGGEEFAVLLPETSPAVAERIAERLRGCLARKVFVSGGARFSATASLGLAALRGGERSAELTERSDQALYRAKEEGRDCWRRA